MIYTQECESEKRAARSPLILCDPVDGSPPGSSVHGILQARMLKCAAMPVSPSNPHLLCLLYLQAGSLPLAPPGKPTRY